MFLPSPHTVVHTVAQRMEVEQLNQQANLGLAFFAPEILHNQIDRMHSDSFSGFEVVEAVPVEALSKTSEANLLVEIQKPKLQ